MPQIERHPLKLTDSKTDLCRDCNSSSPLQQFSLGRGLIFIGNPR